MLHGGSAYAQVQAWDAATDVRRLRREAKQLREARAGGAGQEETLPIYEDLMQAVRRARTDAAHAFTPRTCSGRQPRRATS
jgi:hypothetical protein